MNGTHEPDSDWRAVRLKYFAPAKTERADSNSTDPDYLGLENVESWTGRYVPSEFSEDDANEGTSGTVGVFRANDVLFAKLRPYLAKSFLPKSGGVCSTEFVVMRPTPQLSSRFLHYLFLCPEIIALIESSTFGAKMPRANWEFIGGLRFRLPPIEIQERITDFIDRETREIDDLIAEKSKLMTLLDEKRDANIIRAVTRGLQSNVGDKESGIPWLPRIPVNWKTKRAKYLFRQTRHSIHEDDEIVTCFRDGEVTLRSNRREEGYTNAVLELGYQGVRRGQLVLHSMDAFAGAIGVSDSDGKCSPEYINCDAISERISTIYYARLLRVMAKRGFILAACPAVRERAPRIRFSNFADMRLPVPPFDEQVAIASFIDASLAETLELYQCLRDSVRLLVERRKAIIAASVFGRIRVEEMGS